MVNFTVEEAEFELVNSIEGEESRYELYDIALPWTEAKAKCEELGGHLAVITSQEEQNLIEELFGGGDRGAYWIGITDEETEDVWKAVTGEDVSYYNWMTAELPDNNRNEDYVAIYTVNFGWNDIANTYGGYLGFICEYPKTIPEGLEYEITDGKVTITDYTGSATELEIPSTIEGCPVTVIGDAAFEYCQELESITIPESVTDIGSRAFYNCAELKDLYVPQNVTNIGALAFAACGLLENIVVDESNTVYDSRNNCNAIIETATNTLLTGCAYTVIPSTVTSIGEGAFHSCGIIEEIIIPDGVTSIGKEAFMCCVALKNVTIANSVTSIGESAFVACWSLECITLPKGLTNIDGYAFSGCKALKDVYYGGTEAQWIAVDIASGNEYLTGATIHCATQSYSVTFVDYDGTVLSTQTVEQGTSAVEPETPYRDGYEFTGWDTDFSDVQSDLVVTATYNYLTLISGDFEYTVSNGEVTITDYTGSATNLVVPEYIDGYPVAKLGKDAFSYCQSLASVELPSTLKDIGETAFKYCKTLAGIRIPEGVEVIGKSAFYGCTALTGITIPSTVNRIGDEAFVFCEGLTSAEISEGVEAIGSYAFRGCLELTTVVIPKSVTSVEERAFYGCAELDDVYYGGTSTEWATITIAAYNEPLTTATIHYNSKNVPLGLEYTVANGAVTITGYTGSNAILDIPQTIEGYPVTAIGANAFDSRTNLLSIKLPETITSIGEGAFKYCKGITSMVLPESITEISANAFYGCTSLVEITIPDGVERIGNQAFIYCEALQNVYIPSSVTHIGDFAFRGCLALRDVELPEGLNSIGVSAFRGCSVLREVSLPKSIESIGEKAFYACSKLADVYYGGSELRWSDVSIAEGNDALASATMHYALSSADEIFTVTFVDYDGTVLDEQTIEYGTAAIAPTAPTRDGYTFKGWDKDFSNITENTTVTAQYTRVAPKGTLKIEVTGGTGFTISINGSNARPQGSVYRNSKIEIGSVVTVTARETANSTFVGWMNPITGVVLSSDYVYTFTASGNDSFNAVFTTQIEGVQVVTFKNDKSNRILDSQYYSSADVVTFPDAPTQVGYDFAGWSMTEAEIKSAIANGEDVTVVAKWTKSLVPVEITVNGGTGSGTYYANNAVTVTANEAETGKKFAYWTDAQGNIRSYNAEYTFFPATDTTVTAVFVDADEAIDYQILVSMDSIDTTTVAGKNVFTYSWYCPEEYTFVKAGIVAVNKDNYNEATFVAGSSDANVYDRSPSGDNLKPVNTFTWTKSNVASGQTWVAKAYVQYRDAEGQLITVYSDMVEATKE
ncbi:MAG: leucine-rich repeat protein [Ruminococcus sp.]|nr:leucine-rich repeat protein [Ruminococcus sp.]